MGNRQDINASQNTVIARLADPSHRLIRAIGVAVAPPLYILMSRSEDTPAILAYYGAAIIVYLVVVYMISRTPNQPSLSVWAIITLYAGIRIFLLTAPPLLSDDIYRYYWDGKSIANGISPYHHAPTDPIYDPLKPDPIAPRVNHATLPTIYPPLAECIFFFGYTISKGIYGIKGIYLLFEFFLMLGLLQICKYRHLPLNSVLIYFLHPLVIVETYWSGHIDIVGATLMVAAVTALIKIKEHTSMLYLGLAVLAKFVPVTALPVFFRSLHRKWVIWIVPLIVSSVYIILFSYHPFSLGSLGIFSQKWHFNGFLFTGLSQLSIGGNWIRWISIGVFTGASIMLYLWRNPTASVTDHLAWTLFAFLLCSPVVHPWYMIWLIPFLATTRSLVSLLPILIWSATVGLSYWVLVDYFQTGLWQETALIWYLEYLPVIATTVGMSIARPGRFVLQDARVP